MKQLLDNPKVYVGTYAKYNNGSIEGKWLDLTEYADKDEFLKACAELHADESDPELMFQDYECFPQPYYNESYIDERIWDFIALDEDEREIAMDFIENVDDSVAPEDVRDMFDGNINDMREGWDSDEKTYGYYVVENGIFGVEIPDELESYIDYEAIGRDYLQDIHTTSNGNMFRNQ